MIKRIALLLALLSPMAAHAEVVTLAIAAFAAFATTTVGIIAITATVFSAGMAIYGAAQARRAERQARDQRNAAMQDRMTTKIAAESPHRRIYGRAKVGADIVAMFSSGPKDEYKHIVCVLAAHECDAVEEVYVNNVAVGLLNASGDATTGRFAPIPGTEIFQESKTGPSFTLSKMPVGPVQAFTMAGIRMTEVAVTAQSGRSITVASSGTVIVNYQYNVVRRFDDPVDDAVAAATSPYVRVQIHLGGPTDPADDYLMSVVPDKWPATAVLRGLCYLVVTLDLNNPEFQGGQVPIQALVRGRKLYDPRTGLTAWSQNPPLAVYDYLTSPLCGVAAADLPTAQFITAANVCDETTGGWFDLPRYTINGTVTSAENQASVLESMAQCMAGGIVSTTWDICAGKYIAPVLALTQSDIVGAISITPGVSDAAIYNGVKGQFISPDNSYVMTDFAPFQNPAYLAADGRDLYTDIPFPFTDSLQRVHNLARIFTEDMRNGFTMKAEFSLKAWPLKVGQRVTFTSVFLGQTAKIYRITDKSYAPNSAVELTLKEDDPSIWDFADAVTVDSTPNTDLPDPWAIAPLASISCTSGVSTLLTQPDGSIVPRILVTFPAATTQSVFTNGEIEIEWRAISTETWQRTAVSGSATQAYLSPITPGFFYVVRARTVNPSLNVKSDWVMTTYQVAVFTATATVYKWAADMPAMPSGADAWTWATSTFAAPPSGWFASEPAAPVGGDSTLWTADVPVSDISASSSTPFNWGAASISARGYAPSPAGTGQAGYSNARVFAYQRSASAPAGTPGAVDVDLTTGTITTATLANGWLKARPTANGNPLYITVATASAQGATDTVASGEWSGTVIEALDGMPGAPGLNSHTITIYQRSATATAPALPSASTTYTFATGVLTGLNNGWSQYIPAANGLPFLHASTATAAATTATDAIANTEWAAAQLQSRDGEIAGLFSAKYAWEFRNTLDGWSTSGMSSAVANADFLTVTSASNDPIMNSPAITLNGAIYDKVRARVRRTAGSGWDGTLYYSTTGHGISGSYFNTIPNITSAAWTILEWDMSGITDWKASTVNGIRIDLGTTSGDAFEIDWIVIGKTGPIAIGDLGYTGDMNATNGANWSTNIAGRPSDAELLNSYAVETAATAAQAKADLARVTASAYADGIVTAAEARAIADATAKANAAQATAISAATAKANLARGSNLFTGSLATPYSLNAGASITNAAYPDPYGTTNAVVVSLPSNGSYAHYHFDGLAAGFYTVRLKVSMSNQHSPVVATTNGTSWVDAQWVRGATSSASSVWVQVTLRQYTSTGMLDVVFGSFIGPPAQYTTPAPTALAITDLDVTREGYAGDQDATKGAPAGTLVGGTPATTVESKANGAIPDAAGTVATVNIATDAVSGADVFSSADAGGSTQFTTTVANAKVWVIATVINNPGSGTQGYNIDRYNGSTWVYVTGYTEVNPNSTKIYVLATAGTYRITPIAGNGYVTNISVVKLNK